MHCFMQFWHTHDCQWTHATHEWCMSRVCTLFATLYVLCTSKEQVHRVYTVILDLQFIYTSMCMQKRFGMYITDMHMYLCKLSCTCLVHTWMPCTRASTLLILCTHAHIYKCVVSRTWCRWVYSSLNWAVLYSNTAN